METWQTSTTTAEAPSRARPVDEVGAIDQPGRVRIARRALRTIVREAALSVPGVARMVTGRTMWAGPLGRPRPREGVGLTVHQNVVAVDLYLIVRPGVSMVEVGEAVQESVAAAIERMLGMSASEIDVYIQDVA